VQANAFNRSRIATAIAVILTSNLRLLDAPGNVLIHAQEADLPRDSVANISQVATLDRDMLIERIGRLGDSTMRQVDHGLRLVLALS
jgi:mRNA interferase MazF